MVNLTQMISSLMSRPNFIAYDIITSNLPQPRRILAIVEFWTQIGVKDQLASELKMFVVKDYGLSTEKAFEVFTMPQRMKIERSF